MKAKLTEYKLYSMRLDKAQMVWAYDMSQAYMELLISRGFVANLDNTICRSSGFASSLTDADTYKDPELHRRLWR